MKYIESVRVSKFRSIGINEAFESSDLNILSGSNDSGKSNYLKALNLFFNGQTDLNSRYNHENDFNKWYRDNNIRGERNIEVEIKFVKGNYRDVNGINNGFVARKIFRSDGGQETKFFVDNKEVKSGTLSFNRANGVISEKFRYVYIPAVRDSKFLESVQRLIEEIANSTDKRTKTKDLKEAFNQMEVGVNTELEGLIDKVKSAMNINIETTVNFGTMLESLTFDTTEKISIRKRRKEFESQSVSLKNRGDGIQMQFFSFLLWFISMKDTKHFYIWGYEEPELAFEFKRQFEFSDLFQDTFSEVAQIFLTTHSPAFAFIDNNPKTKVFRVSQDLENFPKTKIYSSKLTNIQEYYEGLFKDLESATGESKSVLERDIWGMNAQKISKMIGESLNEVIGLRQISNNEIEDLKIALSYQKSQYIKLQTKVDEIEADLKRTYPNKIFICEDKNGISLWESLLHEKAKISRDGFRIFSSKGCSNNEVEKAISHLKKIRQNYNPKIFRQCDRDGFLDEQVNAIVKVKQSKYKDLNYRLEFLPVNELENFAILADSYFTDSLVKDFENYSKLSMEFNGTITSNLQAAIKLVEEVDKNLFNSTQTKMTNYANTNILKFYPGKEIKKLKPNFNPDAFLKDCAFQDLPPELIDFLVNIKTYYET